MSNKQIARHLGLELSTITNHVHSILVKLRVSSRTKAVGLMKVANATR
jgi:DNA-binding NarL/FixJ family response regulator